MERHENETYFLSTYCLTIVIVLHQLCHGTIALNYTYIYMYTDAIFYFLDWFDDDL
jgi:hypothetical protein